MTDVEPQEWQPRLPLSQRVKRAVTVPVFVGVAVFVAVVVVAIVIVVFRSTAGALEIGSAPEIGVDETAAEAELGEEGAASVPDQGTSITAEGAAEVSGDVFVHVVGEVADPGVVTLTAGARVEAAIDAAGGATADAVLAGVNLARPVVDGEQIVVPDAELAAAGTGAAGGAGASGTSGGGTSPGAGPNGSGEASSGGMLNLNTADAVALETLPRIGPSLAQRIIDWRDANGPFASVEQLTEVSGIGQKTLDGFRELVTV